MAQFLNSSTEKYNISNTSENERIEEREKKPTQNTKSTEGSLSTLTKCTCYNIFILI